MRLEYGLPIPLRFYESVSYQNRFKLGASVRVFKLYCPVNRILPFQIKTESSEPDISGMSLVSIETGQATNVFGLLPNGQLRTYMVGESKYFVHYGNVNLNIPTTEGEFYLEVTNGQSTWYSEVMTMKSFSYDIMGEGCILTRIEYWATCDIDEIFYRGPLLGHPQYKNVIYLDVEPGKPNYLYEEEGEEDGDKVFVADLKTLQKEYYLQTPMPQFVTDALTLLPMHVGRKGVVEVMTNRGYLSRIDRVRVEPEWQRANGVWAMTDIFLITETVLSETCCPGIDDVVAGGSITADCFDSPTEALATLVLGSFLYNNEHYRPLATGVATPVPEDSVVIVAGVNPAFTIQRLTGGTFVDEAPIAGQVFLDMDVYNSDESTEFPYVYATGNGAEAQRYPKITSNTDNMDGTWTIQGICYSDCIVDIYNRVNGNNVLVGTMPSNTFIASGATFTREAGSDRVFIHCRTDNGCDLLTSNLRVFEAGIGGIGNMTIGTDFFVDETIGELP